MAPTKEAPKARPPSQKVIDSGITNSKPKSKGAVRRFENGMLDVSRKSGKYAKICRQNAQSRLLRLPAELRNQIWELVLGGRTITESSGRSRDHSCNLALLQTCRQIYAETALLPFQLNEFCMSLSRHMNWFLRFRKCERDNIRHIRLIIYDIEWHHFNVAFGGHSSFNHDMSALSHGRKSMLVEVRRLSTSLFSNGNTYLNGLNGPRWAKRKEDFLKLIKDINQDIEVSFEFSRSGL